MTSAQFKYLHGVVPRDNSNFTFNVSNGWLLLHSKFFSYLSEGCSVQDIAWAYTSVLIIKKPVQFYGR